MPIGSALGLVEYGQERGRRFGSRANGCTDAAFGAVDAASVRARRTATRCSTVVGQPGISGNADTKQCRDPRGAADDCQRAAGELSVDRVHKRHNACDVGRVRIVDIWRIAGSRYGLAYRSDSGASSCRKQSAERPV
jgi:hypothetical protein